MKNLYILLVLLSSFSHYAQEEGEEFVLGDRVSPRSAYIQLKGNFNMKNYSNPTGKVIGSYYLFEDWKTTGKIITEENKEYKITELNYDTNSNQIVAKSSKDSIFVFRTDFVKQAIINNRVFKKLINPQSGEYIYFELIAKGKDLEVLKWNLKAIRTGIVNHLTMEKEDDYFISKEKYYLKSTDDLIELPTKKNSFLELFGEASKTLKEFIKKNNLSIKESKDLKKIFNFYDSLENNL